MRITSIKLLIVDESPSFCAAVRKAFDTDGSIRVVGTACSAGEASRRIRELDPDVVAADPALTDFENVLAGPGDKKSRPVIAVGDRRPDPGLSGVYDFVRKPALKKEEEFSSFCNELGVKVKMNYRPRPAVKAETPSNHEMRRHLVVIGASTGGTEATAEIMRRLPGDLPGIVIVQHMPAGFTNMYAERLNRLSRFEVFEARDGDRIKPGTALVAPGGLQLSVKKDRKGYYVQCREGPKVNGHCPSVGVLFDSAAKEAGSDAVGVILTGMGKDGAEGLLKMRKAGARTIGQDRESSVVYGMPMAANEIGAVEKQAPLEKIADIIVDRVFG